MPYLTYGRDMLRAANQFRKPAKEWAKSLVKIHDPFKLFMPTAKFVAHGIDLNRQGTLLHNKKSAEPLTARYRNLVAGFFMLQV